MKELARVHSCPAGEWSAETQESEARVRRVWVLLGLGGSKGVEKSKSQLRLAIPR